MNGPGTLYRLLLKLYPARFREEYEKPLERQFRDEYNEIHGLWPSAVFWLRALADLALSIPVEILHEVRQDLSYAFRLYRKHRFTMMLAVVALALTIGVTTGVFSIVNALLFRSLPFRDPERLVQLHNFQVSVENAAAFHAWATSRPYLTDAAGYRVENMTFTAAGQARRVNVAETSSNFFSLLGSEPFIGRAFALGEDTRGATDVAIVGYGLWQQLGADPRILGSTIHVNGVPLTVIGIAQNGLDYPHQTALWVPTLFYAGHISRARALTWEINGRLKSGISLHQGSAEYRADNIAFAKSKGNELDPNTLAGLRLVSLRDRLAGNVRQISLVLFGIVVFVLLTACANVAHLLLSRITERRKELVLRAALGASRGRLMQQLVTETTALTVAAALGGQVVAEWVARLALMVQPPSLTTQEYTVLDLPVLLFAVGIAILTGLVFGVLPAGFVRRMQPGLDPLRLAGTHNGGVRRVRSVLVALQAAFTVVLLAGALTMGRSFLRLAGTDLRLRTDHVVTMNVALSGTPREKNAPAYYRAALDKLRTTPGVESAGAVEYLPLGPFSIASFPFRLDNGPESRFAAPITATPNYLRTTGTQIIDGRDFTAAEEAAATPVAIVNEAFARQFDATLHVVGKRLTPAFGEPMTIIGVARTQRYSPTDDDMAIVYRLAGWAPVLNMTLVARVHGNAELYVPVCRDALRSLDPNVPVYNVMTFDQRLSETLLRPRFYTMTILFFSCFALLLATIGIYGAASFAVQQRRHEIGVRLAVGAQPRQLRAALAREGLLPVAAGLLLGILAAIAFGKLLEHLMEGADPVGLPICTAAGVTLLAVAASANWAATHRIVQMDTMKILRAD